MPLIMFADDPDFSKGDAFCVAMLKEGIYFHPKHNMFLCAAHSESDIDTALAASEVAFSKINATA
jgi:glutamate-1-semialdehyde 2,1-aminomutase